MLHWLAWDVPDRVRACTTLRHGGQSIAPFDGFNLAEHVGDDAQAVASNRLSLACAIGQEKITWLNQVHGTTIVNATNAWQKIVSADGVHTAESGTVCCVMSADCLPVFLCDPSGAQVAVVHAGWRGLLAGVLQNALACFSKMPPLAYLGPAIGQNAFEVGQEVYQAFVQQRSSFRQAFLPAKRLGYWYMDIYHLARLVLTALGVTSIQGGERCTYSEPESFFSYRRNKVTGRMANLIWLE